MCCMSACTWVTSNVNRPGRPAPSASFTVKVITHLSSDNVWVMMEFAFGFVNMIRSFRGIPVHPADRRRMCQPWPHMRVRSNSVCPPVIASVCSYYRRRLPHLQTVHPPILTVRRPAHSPLTQRAMRPRAKSKHHANHHHPLPNHYPGSSSPSPPAACLAPRPAQFQPEHEGEGASLRAFLFIIWRSYIFGLSTIHLTNNSIFTCRVKSTEFHGLS